MSSLKTLFDNHSAAVDALWEHAQRQHLTHSPEPEYPTEYLSCLREPCKTIRDTIWPPEDD